MGYANTLPYQQITVTTPQRFSQLQLTNVDADYTIETLTIPTFTQPLVSAYLDVFINSMQNTSANDNNLNPLSSGEIGWVYGGTFRQAHDGKVGVELRCPGSSWHTGLYVISCENDMKNYVASGGSYSVYFKNYSCAFNNLYLWGVYAQLRMYFGVQ